MTALAAVGGQWLNTNFAVLFDIQSFLYNLFLDPLTASDFDGYALTNSPVPDPFDLANIVYSANMVVPRLKFFTNQFAYNEIEYLIYCVLHDKDPIWNGPYSADFEFLLNEAPCEGPHYYNSNLNISGNFIPQLKSIYWSKPSRWKNGYELFEHALDDVNNGEYSGLDYMLLFNVYCLLNPSYVSYSFNAANRCGRIISKLPIYLPLSIFSAAAHYHSCIQPKP
ncbi:MAG TPA: hypothetical protein PK323_15165 [Bacteroidia bacterium]|nr:hypothetical protein [Bacteroidia bacterium]